MSEIVWKEEYYIGIEEIDKQHMDFIKLINRFDILFGTGSYLRLQDRIMLEILKYFEYHSISEENLMIISRYPNVNDQEKEHKVFIKLFHDKCYGLKNGSINGRDIITYLFNWFLNHTQKEDRRFAEYICRTN
jgi:hemerythrin